MGRYRKRGEARGLSWRKGHAESRFKCDLIRTRTAEGRIKNLAALGSDRPVGILTALAKDVADIRLGGPLQNSIVVTDVR